MSGRSRRFTQYQCLLAALIIALALALLLVIILAAQLMMNRTDTYIVLPAEQASLEVQEGITTAVEKRESGLLDGSITYSLDERAVHLIFDLKNVHSNLRITFINEEGSGVILGEGNALMKLGEIQDEVILSPVNHGIVFWSQIPRRILGGSSQFTIKIEDAISSLLLAEASVVLHHE
ncbi:hypothetical protein [Paenibacillus senegalensis]|uniref:hypothetical protein n=1 Tax=Paenibacillus senegalensis TaxID=1465766 RepID=UPI00028901AE|nr:hypothetical protein [Paenibacillus senegalensis]